MKYYAIKSGRKTGIFNSWTEAEGYVKGFPNAKYKLFTSIEEAEEYLGNLNNNDNTTTTSYIAYVDGSFDKKLNVYGSGVVIVHNQVAIKEISFCGNNEKYVESFQVAGEVLASIKAMEWAIENNVREITICYDYEGIQAWALGEWKTSKPVSKNYREKFENLSGQVKVYFKKVRAHSGVHFNELADQLAKKGIKEGVFFSEITEQKNKNTNSDLYELLLDTDSINKQGGLIRLGDFIISDKKIVKFIKEKWKSEGRKIGEIKKLTYDLDLNKNILFATIESNETVELEFKI